MSLQPLVASNFGRIDFEAIASGKYRFGDPRHIFSDIKKLSKLGWRPHRSTTDSVESYKAWLDQADSVADILDHCQRQMSILNVVRDVVKQ